MKYVALLRGINVGGNNIIKMLELKESFELGGYTEVITFIQSGNVIFESPEKDSNKLARHIEKILTKKFSYNALVVVKSHEQMKDIVKHAPNDWHTRIDIRCYLGFLLEDMEAEQVFEEVRVREGVDTLDVKPGVVYMTTVLTEITKSAFNKLVGKPIYKKMTIRNFNTTEKILALMEKV